MTTIAKLLHESLEKQYMTDGLTIEEARNQANDSDLIHYVDETDMAQEGLTSYRYTYKDESELIIDDEGYIYCDEDSEIRILAD
jgi:hypothetical protein